MSTSRDITKERKRDDSGLSINKRGKRFYSLSTPAWVSAYLPVSPENTGRASTSERQSVVCAMTHGYSLFAAKAHLIYR